MGALRGGNCEAKSARARGPTHPPIYYSTVYYYLSLQSSGIIGKASYFRLALIFRAGDQFLRTLDITRGSARGERGRIYKWAISEGIGAGQMGSPEGLEGGNTRSYTYVYSRYTYIIDLKSERSA